MLGNLIGSFIIILVGVSLLPVVSDSIACVRDNTTCPANGHQSVTGAAGTILGLTNIFFALGIMSTGVALTATGLRNAGMV